MNSLLLKINLHLSRYRTSTSIVHSPAHLVLFNSCYSLLLYVYFYALSRYFFSMHIVLFLSTYHLFCSVLCKCKIVYFKEI